SNIDVALLKLSATTPLLLLYFFLDASARNKALNFTAYTVIIVCAVGIIQKTTFLLSGSAGAFSGRIYSTLGNPNFLASFLLISFPLFASWADKKNRGSLALLPYTCILLTQTAGSILSLLVILGLFFARDRKKAKLSFPGVLFPVHLLIIICALFLFGLSSKKMSVQERLFKWRSGIEIVKENPLLGVGWGGVKTNFALYQQRVKRDFALKSTSESKIHNDYIQIAAESGIIGFLAYGALLFSAILLLRKNNFYAFAGLAALMLDSVTNFPVELPASLMLLALILSFDGETEKGNNPLFIVFNSPFFVKGMARFFPSALRRAIALLCLFFLFISVKDFVADISRKKGYDSYAVNDFKSAESAWIRAHRISPTSGKTAYALGMLYVNAKRYPEAINMFKESIKIRNYGEVYNNLGNAFYLNGNNAEALPAWEKAVELGCPGKENIQKNINSLKTAVD
ncbi:tetratricopeptide repeat protein, partial [bacterium]|nr:tetratricopeptide repeat protein [bacterium]